MFPYIYLKKNEKANFINLTKTARLLTYAENYVQMAATEQKTFLFKTMSVLELQSFESQI